MISAGITTFAHPHRSHSMIDVRSRLIAACLLVSALAVSGCRGNSEGAGDPSRTAEIDTTNQEALDGLSTEQVQRSAEPLSPEAARQRGLADTTIHLENLGNPDTILPETRGPEQRPDTSRSDSATGTRRPAP